MRILFALSFLLGYLSAFSQETKPAICLLSLGNVPSKDIALIETALEQYYSVEITVLKPIKIPKHLWNEGKTKSVRVIEDAPASTPAPASKSFDPDKLIPALSAEQKTSKKLPNVTMVLDSNVLQIDKACPYLLTLKPREYRKIIGLTRWGISVAQEQATIRGIACKSNSQSAIVSTYLVKEQTKTQKEYDFRIAKVALHEYGHTLGLEHCKNSKDCFMIQSSMDGEAFYQTKNQLCEKCQLLVDQQRTTK